MGIVENTTVSGQVSTDGTPINVVFPATQEILISNTSDSVAIGTSTQLFTATTVGPKVGLDTNIISSVSLAVTGPLTDAQLRASAVPVSAASLPLPAGAATSANQVTEITAINAVNTTLGIPMQQTGGSVSVTNFPATQTVAGTITANQGTGGSSAWKVDGSTVTQPISAASLPLPTGAATAALQTTGNTSLASIDAKLVNPMPVTGPLTDTQLRATPVPISAASLPLPTGAATAVNQTNASQKTQVVDGSGSVQGPVQTISGTNYMPVTLAASATPGSAVVARSVQVAGTDGTNARTLLTDTAGAVVVTPTTWSYRNVHGTALTVVKSGAGIFHAIVQNSQVGTTTIYDNTAASGTVIASINAAGSPGTIFYSVAFSTGLTVVTTNGSNDVTVLYK